MPTIDVYNMAGQGLRHARTERQGLCRAGQRTCHPFGGQSISAQPETGHAVHPDAHRGCRRRQKAVETEGHRPCQTGFDPRAAVDARRRRARPEAQKLQSYPSIRRKRESPCSSALSAKVSSERPDCPGRYRARRVQDQERSSTMLGALGANGKADDRHGSAGPEGDQMRCQHPRRQNGATSTRSTCTRSSTHDKLIVAKAAVDDTRGGVRENENSCTISSSSRLSPKPAIEAYAESRSTPSEVAKDANKI